MDFGIAALWAGAWLAAVGVLARLKPFSGQPRLFAPALLVLAGFASATHASLPTGLLLVVAGLAIPNGPVLSSHRPIAYSAAASLRDRPGDYLMLLALEGLITLVVLLLLAGVLQQSATCAADRAVPAPTALKAGVLFMAVIATAGLNQILLPKVLGHYLSPLCPPAFADGVLTSGKMPFHPSRAGRLIGIIERYLVVVFMAIGSTAAIGLIFAAKSVSRLKELENHAFVEYFLVGSLASLMAGVSISVLVIAAITHGGDAAHVSCR